MKDYKNHNNVGKPLTDLFTDDKFDIHMENRLDLVRTLIGSQEQKDVLGNIINFFLSFEYNDHYLDELTYYNSNCPSYLWNIWFQFVKFLCHQYPEIINIFISDTVIDYFITNSLHLIFEVPDIMIQLLSFANYLVIHSPDKQFNESFYELSFQILLPIQSDYPQLNRIEVKSDHQLRRKALELLINIAKKLCLDFDRIQEICQQFMIYLKFPCLEIQCISLYGISHLIFLYPNTITYEILHSGFFRTIVSFMSKDSHHFLQSTSLDVLINISSIDDDRFSLFLLESSILNHIDFHNRDTQYILSSCILAQNLISSGPMVVDSIFDQDFLIIFIPLLFDSSYTIKIETSILFIKIMSFHRSLRFLAENDIIQETIHIILGSNDHYQDELMKSLFKLWMISSNSPYCDIIHRSIVDSISEYDIDQKFFPFFHDYSQSDIT